MNSNYNPFSTKETIEYNGAYEADLSRIKGKEREFRDWLDKVEYIENQLYIITYEDKTLKRKDEGLEKEWVR